MDADSRSPRDGKLLEVLVYTIPSWKSCGGGIWNWIHFTPKLKKIRKEINLNKQLPYLVRNIVEAIQALIIATLEMLNALIAANGDKLGSAAYVVIIEELSTVMSALQSFFVVLIPFADTSLDDILGLLISIDLLSFIKNVHPQ
ncbi:hypothetical protein OROMI_016948 [Orobanche minor]